MGTLIIDEQSYIIKKISTTIEGKHLILEFETSTNETKKYCIFADDNFRDIVLAYEFIQDKIINTIKNNQPFVICDEYPRPQISIGDSNDDVIQEHFSIRRNI